MSFNIVRNLGKQNEAYFPNGRRVVRADKLFMKIGETIHLVPVAPHLQVDHFAWQNKMPITKEEYERYRSSGRGIPRDRIGVCCFCSCGSPIVVALSAPKPDDENLNKACCQSVLMFGEHQTSFKIEGGKMILSRKQQENLLMDPSEVLKTMKDPNDR